MYEKFFGNPDFEWVLFNSNPNMWGQITNGLSVHSPDEIATLGLDIVIVCTYRYDTEIYNNISQYEDVGVKIVKLHRETDVPWVY
jgi:hypothetical protein